MLAMFIQSVVPLADLQFATVRCNTCKTEVTIDLAYKKWGEDPNRDTPSAPAVCPVCGARFDLTVTSAIDQIRGAYGALSKQQTATVEFRVRRDVSSNQ